MMTEAISDSVSKYSKALHCVPIILRSPVLNHFEAVNNSNHQYYDPSIQ
jgi:hypothetical protein